MKEKEPCLELGDLARDFQRVRQHHLDEQATLRTLRRAVADKGSARMPAACVRDLVESGWGCMRMNPPPSSSTRAVYFKAGARDATDISRIAPYGIS